MTILAIADRHRGRVVVTGVDATKSEGTAAAQRASAIVVAMLGLLVATKIADATGNVGWRLVPFVAALFVLPFLYVMPVTRHLWTNHRYWLLGIQAVLTYAPFGVFGANWTTGVTGLLGGLVLLTVAAPFSWLLFGTLIAVEGVIRIGLVGPPRPRRQIGFRLRPGRLRRRGAGVVRAGPAGGSGRESTRGPRGTRGPGDRPGTAARRGDDAVGGRGTPYGGFRSHRGRAARHGPRLGASPG